MRGRSNPQSISALLALVLLGVFGVSILSVLLSGAGTYRRIAERDRQAYDSRTCAQYIATRVRQAPPPAAVSPGQFGGSSALEIRQEVEGKAYLTRIYCHDGWLMELFSTADGAFAPEDGERLMQAEAVTFTAENGLLSAEILCSGERVQVMLRLSAGEGGLS